MLKEHFIIKTNPVAIKENIIYFKNYRITVLKDRLFRLEQSKTNTFNDQATQVVIRRNLKKVPFKAEICDDTLYVKTHKITLMVKEHLKDCKVLVNGKWEKLNNEHNLKGTYRTLDCCDGEHIISTPWAPHNLKDNKVYFDNGVASKNGVAIIDDSNSLLLDEGMIKENKYQNKDIYVFCYKNDYKNALVALYDICGYTPLLPRFAFGNWWSRYYDYSQREYCSLINKFKEHDIPLTVAVIDMDWHYSINIDQQLKITESGKNTSYYGGNSGWTGYTWNPDLFPNYQKFLKTLKDENLKVTLNLHPADGIRWFEKDYKKMARAMGIDESSEQQIPFDFTSPLYINNYFEHILNPYEKDGVDFWWIDWQQGTTSLLSGLDPLWSLNHFHTLDILNSFGYSLILSRYSGIGSHRYPIGFSGDTFITWETLDYLPYFTSNATNVGYTWWSHDIGGHMGGCKSDELYLRHLQYGVFSPINRLHSSNAHTASKEPWVYTKVEQEAIKFLKLRHQLIPYLYDINYKTYKNGVALVEPLYYYVKNKRRYQYRNEYFFGGQLLISPITSKVNSYGYAKTKMYLPKGRWIDIFTDDIYESKGREYTMYRDITSIPVLAKSGAIIPLSLDNGNSIENPVNLKINIYKGNNTYKFYEDKALKASFMIFDLKTSEGNLTLNIKHRGSKGVIPKNRIITLEFKDIKDAIEIKCNFKYKEIIKDYVSLTFEYEEEKEYQLQIKFNDMTPLDYIHERAKKELLKAEYEFDKKEELLNEVLKTSSISDYQKVVKEKSFNKMIMKKLLEIL